MPRVTMGSLVDFSDIEDSDCNEQFELESIAMSTSTSQDHAPFSYGNLDKDTKEFRVIELLPSDVGDEVACRMMITSVVKPSRPFKALSYTWGTDLKSYFISVVDADWPGNSKHKVIPITESLNTALRHLRREHDPVTLWIDQICINQGCNVEKGEQVQLMGDIYSGAEQALVWLGPADNDSDSLMEVWRSVGQAARDFGMEGYHTMERLPLLFRIMSNADPSDPKTTEYNALLSTSAEAFLPLICNRTLQHWFACFWFARAWVTQEFCLCPSTLFVCGTHTLPVELVMLAIQILHSSIGNLAKTVYIPRGAPLSLLTPLADEPTARLFSCRLRRQKLDRGEPGATGDQLHALLRKLYVDHYTAASLHRDRIFSLLGLAVDTASLGITPDYTDPGNPAADARALTCAARAMITNSVTGRVDVLCYAQFPKTPALADHLPSWVPDWRGNLARSFYEVNEVVEEHLFNACGEQGKVQPRECEDPRVLGLAGYLVDTVECVAPGKAWEDMSLDAGRFVGFFGQVDGLVRRGLGRAATEGNGGEVRKGLGYRSREELEQARWRVPTGGLYWTAVDDMHRAPPEAATYYQQCLEAVTFLDECGRLSDTKQTVRFEEWKWAEKVSEGKIGADYRESMKYMTGKRPFLTSGGYLGMGPADVAKGDVVVVFCGGRIPFVLRPLGYDMAVALQREIKMYGFVGEAYCDGVMDGEVVVNGEGATYFFMT